MVAPSSASRRPSAGVPVTIEPISSTLHMVIESIEPDFYISQPLFLSSFVFQISRCRNVHLFCCLFFGLPLQGAFQCCLPRLGNGFLDRTHGANGSSSVSSRCIKMKLNDTREVENPFCLQSRLRFQCFLLCCLKILKVFPLCNILRSYGLDYLDHWWLNFTEWGSWLKCSRLRMSWISNHDSAVGLQPNASQCRGDICLLPSAVWFNKRFEWVIAFIPKMLNEMLQLNKHKQC